MTQPTPRGLRNNNPGNIRLSSTKYQGEVQPSQDTAFKQFESMPTATAPFSYYCIPMTYGTG